MHCLGALGIMDMEQAAPTLLSALSSSPPHSPKPLGTLRGAQKRLLQTYTEQHKNTLQLAALYIKGPWSIRH